MTTIVTDGVRMFADVRTTHMNLMGFACNDCGSTGYANKQDSKKIINMHRSSPEQARYLDGKVAMMYGAAGSANLGHLLKHLWVEKSDLRHLVKALQYINLEKTPIPEGIALIVLEDNSVYRFSISPKKKLIALTKIEAKELPVAIGSGATYFKTYLESFNIGWFDAFQMAIHRDPHSSTDVCHSATIVPAREEGKLRVSLNDDVKFFRTYGQTLRIAQRRMKLQ